MFNIIWWVFVGIAIVGTVYISILRKVYLGHVFWIIANVGLIVCNAYMKIWPMVGLFSIYLILSSWGLFRWRLGTNR